MGRCFIRYPTSCWNVTAQLTDVILVAKFLTSESKFQAWTNSALKRYHRVSYLCPCLMYVISIRPFCFSAELAKLIPEVMCPGFVSYIAVDLQIDFQVLFIRKYRGAFAGQWNICFADAFKGIQLIIAPPMGISLLCPSWSAAFQICVYLSPRFALKTAKAVKQVRQSRITTNPQKDVCMESFGSIDIDRMETWTHQLNFPGKLPYHYFCSGNPMLIRWVRSLFETIYGKSECSAYYLSRTFNGSRMGWTDEVITAS